VLPVPILAVAVIAKPDSDWRPIFTNALPFYLLLSFWLFLLGLMPRRNAKKQMAVQSHLREPITYTFTCATISGAGQKCALEHCLERFKASSRDEESIPSLSRSEHRCDCAEAFLPEPVSVRGMAPVGGELSGNQDDREAGICGSAMLSWIPAPTKSPTPLPASASD
jgi:hypothetical protein